MKNIVNILLVLFSGIFLLSCEDTYLPPSLEYVTFGKSVYTAGVDVGSATTVDIPVYIGFDASSDTSFNVIVDGSGAADGSYTVPSTVTIAGGTNEGTLTVGLSDVNLGIGVNKVTINFETAAGFSYGDPTTIEYIQNCAEVTLTLDLTFTDSWPEEAYWEIQDSLGGVVASVPEGTYAGMTSATETITLCGGRNFTFILKDGFSDGGHTYTLKLGSVVKAEVTDPYSYEASISTEFDTL